MSYNKSMFYCRLEILIDKFNRHIPAQLTSWQRLVVNLAPQKISEMILLNIADKDVAQYKQETEIPKTYTGKKVNQLLDVQFESKSVMEIIEDEIMSEGDSENENDWVEDEELSDNEDVVDVQ